MTYYEQVYSSTDGDDYDDSPNCEFLSIVLSDSHGQYIPQIFCQDEANHQAWKDAHIEQIATPDKDNPNLIHYSYLPLTTTVRRPKQLSPIKRLINTWRFYIKRGYWVSENIFNTEEVKIPVLENYDAWEICIKGPYWEKDVIDTSLSPFQRLIHNWRSYLHYGTWEEECLVKQLVYNESYWDAWEDILSNWHYTLPDGRKVTLYQEGDLWEVTYDKV